MNLLTETSQMLTLLAVFAIGLAFYRWPNARSKWMLSAFILLMAGSIVRELALFVWGNGYGSGAAVWPAAAEHLSAAGRIMKIIAAMIFIREVTKEKHGEAIWTTVLVLTALSAALWR